MTSCCRGWGPWTSGSAGSSTFGSNRIEVSLDVYNITNANTIFSVRTNTGLTPVFLNNKPALSSQIIPSFDSPTGVTAPRIARFNLTWSFGAR